MRDQPDHSAADHILHEVCRVVAEWLAAFRCVDAVEAYRKANPKRALQLRKKGNTIAEIMKALNVSRDTVQRYLRAEKVKAGAKS